MRPRLAFEQQAIIAELVHDDGNGLRRKPGHAGDFDLGQLPVEADQREHKALVVEAHAGLVGASRRGTGACSSLPVGSPGQAQTP